MRIALAQIDPTVGDLAGNRRLILARAEEARRLGADLAVFPEMAITGYPPKDLLLRRAFVDRSVEAVHSIAREAPIALVVGGVLRNPERDGKGLHNAAFVLAGGAVASVHRKCLLPTYDVFDEDRYFEPARGVDLARIGGLDLGVTICEDIWNEPGFLPRRLYRKDPVADLASRGARIIINISSSPYHQGKIATRFALIATHARRHGIPVAYVNQVGGNDDLVFDGSSVVVDGSGAARARAASFREDLVLFDTESGRGDIRASIDDPTEEVIAALVLGLRDYLAKCGFKRVVVGLSGGIDSAVTAAIACQAIGAENVLGVRMPSRYSSPGSLADAEALARNLGMPLKTFPIEGVFQAYLDLFAEEFRGLAPDVAEENIQARIRGAILMALSNKHGHLVLTTGNKAELGVGYCTLYGDMTGGLAVISDVPKMLVYEIARHLNRKAGRDLIPRASIEKPPSAELKPDQRDQDSLPPYEVLDPLLQLYVEDGLERDEIAARGFDPAVVDSVVRMVSRNEYKRHQAAPGIRVTSRAFGPGRRMPIAQRYGG